jgi:hypothetical protein
MNRTLGFLSPERSVARYIIGTAALTVAIQIAYDLAKIPFGILGGLALAGLLILVVVLILLLDARLARQRLVGPVANKPAAPHKGLIVLVSPGNLDVPLQSVQHHAQVLQHCWLIASHGGGQDCLASQRTAAELAEQIRLRWPQVQVHHGSDYQADPDDVVSAWKLVDQVYAAASQLDLAATDILADITGGLKPMTAGMALACLAPERDMQYMKTVRDENGEPQRGAPLIAVQISTREIHGAGGQA